MKFETIQIIYPEGDSREISRHLSLNELVDINGYPATLPLPTPKTIIYRVFRKSTSETTNGPVVSYCLEQLTIDETRELSI